MSDMQIQAVLAQMRALAGKAAAEPAQVQQANGTAFGELLSRSIGEVNASQASASDLAARFTAGAEDVSLPEVMVAMQKAGLEFEAVTQVRNRLVAAYQEIMNMPV